MQKALLSIAAATLSMLWAATGYSQDASEYLVCQDIGGFKDYRCACGTGKGIVGPADHFGEDHNDINCTVTYHSMAQRLTVKAEVTRHTDAPDAIMWLLHEIDKEYRTYYGAPDPGYIIKNINGNTLYAFESAGWDYRWISGNNVIRLEYHDSKMTKPEPMEVVRAYLSKHPSTLSATTTSELRSVSNKTKWIKDEMDRRLWLCDKWFLQSTLKKADEKHVREEPVQSMNVFLDYREKYFGIKAAGEKNVLASYLNSNNGVEIKAKLTEYKKWWAVNKDKALSR